MQPKTAMKTRTTTSTRRTTAATVLLSVAVALGVGPVSAQEFTVGWNPRSGDVWVDTWLGDINRYGARYREPFIDELVRYHRAPRDLVVELLDHRGWAPGDVYYACALAEILGRPCRYVVDVYERDRGAGWGAIAQRLGIQPGSPEFHRLKRGFVPTYDRWARPIELDDDLHRAYPDRGKARMGGTRAKSAAKAAGQPERGPAAAGPSARGDQGGKRKAGADKDEEPGRSKGKGPAKGRSDAKGKGGSRGKGSD